mmetsp:Transcript_135/g.263  ORF Transcript_135/g.263 Transcript_135/m.263 type:complete len:559 (-) Transcript_135:309-1985(-)
MMFRQLSRTTAPAFRQAFEASAVNPFRRLRFFSGLSIETRKVLIPTNLDPAARDMLQQQDYEVVLDGATPLAELVAAHQDAFAMIVRSEKIDQAVMDQLPKLKMIVRAGAGFNTIDIKAARKKGIDVMNTPGANANAVAEEVVAMALAALRHIVPADISTRAGKWEKKKFMGRELTGKTVGILGLGNIGQLINARIKGFNCKVMGFDPVISASKAEQMGVTLASVEEIFESCDIVTLHIPENDATRKMVNAKLLNSMKDDAILINCARQGVVHEDDLREVKQTKNIQYCTDVYVKDEAGDKPIKDVASIMLPHIGANTKEANNTAATRAASQIIEYVEKGVSSFIVNRATPPGLDSDYQKLAYYLGRVAFAWEGQQPELIETSIYGDIHQFSNHLVPPLVLGMSSDFDNTWGFEDCLKYLEKNGVRFANRAADDAKGYGNSITVDMVGSKAGKYNKVSIRGTIAEGRPTISRIDDFDGVYFNPVGYSLLARYPDRPGQLARITKLLSMSSVNILDIRCPQDKGGRSLAVLSLDGPVTKETLEYIEDVTDADKVVQFHL